MDAVLGWLDTHQADVLCVQETKVQDSEFPLEPIEAAGYQVVFKGQKSYNGVAILSKERATEVLTGFDSEENADESRLLQATVGPITFVNTYVPQGRDIEHEMYGYKCEWFGRLRDLFDQRFSHGDLVVWLGDMNVAHDPIDVHNPKERKKHVCFHEDARKAFADCRDWGFVDVFRQHHPEAGHYTFFDYRTPNSATSGRGWRIDYILTSPTLAKHCTDCFIDIEPRLQPKPSDHTFMVADFDL